MIALLVGVIVFMQYMNQPQETTTKAAVPGGIAEVAFKQPSLSIKSGEQGTATVTFNTKNTKISAIGVRITYTYTGSEAPLTIDESDIKINPVLVNWSCPTSSFIPGSGTATLEFGCVIVQGYSNNVATDLFSFKLAADDAATAQTANFSFASAQTTIFDKTTGEDVAAIPRGTLAVTISATATPTPSPSPSASPTPTPSTSPTPTPTPSASATPALTSCNGSCVANRDCANNLSCIAGKCRDYRCSSDTSCQCDTTTSTASALPVSGFDQTLTMFMLGMLFLLGGAQLLYTFAWRTQEVSVEEE